MLLFGDGVLSLRALSALFGSLTVPIMYLIGERIEGRLLGLICALICMLSPVHVSYAQDIRMYPMLTLSAAFALYCAITLLKDPVSFKEPLKLQGKWSRTRYWWFALIVSGAAVMFGHNTAVLYWVALGIFIAIAFGLPHIQKTLNAIPKDYGFRNWLVAWVGSLFIWFLWLLGFLTQTQAVSLGFWIQQPTLNDILQHWIDLINAYSNSRKVALVLLFYVFVLVCIACWVLRSKPRLLILLLTLLFVPFAGQVLVSMVVPIFQTRSLLWTSIPLYVLIAIGLYALKDRRVIVIAMLALLLNNIYSLHNFYVSPSREDWREVATWVHSQAQAGDLILFNARWIQLPFEYYYRRMGLDAELHGLPGDLYNDPLESVMQQKYLPYLQARIDGKKRIWLIYAQNWYTDPEAIIPRYLENNYKQRAYRKIGEIQIYLFESEYS